MHVVLLCGSQFIYCCKKCVQTFVSLLILLLEISYSRYTACDYPLSPHIILWMTYFHSVQMAHCSIYLFPHPVFFELILINAIIFDLYIASVDTVVTTVYRSMPTVGGRVWRGAGDSWLLIELLCSYRQSENVEHFEYRAVREYTVPVRSGCVVANHLPRNLAHACLPHSWQESSRGQWTVTVWKLICTSTDLMWVDILFGYLPALHWSCYPSPLSMDVAGIHFFGFLLWAAEYSYCPQK
jgi:hypothetical protein